MEHPTLDAAQLAATLGRSGAMASTVPVEQAEIHEDHREAVLVRVMCAVLAVSSGGYYAWRAHPENIRAAANRALFEDIRRTHAASRHRYGSPRAHAALHAEGKQVERHRTAGLMHRHGIQARYKRRFRHATNSNHALPLAPNLLARQFTATAPNRVWLADITYVPTAEGWLYRASTAGSRTARSPRVRRAFALY
jgi:hypothetical protein